MKLRKGTEGLEPLLRMVPGKGGSPGVIPKKGSNCSVVFRELAADGRPEANSPSPAGLLSAGKRRCLASAIGVPRGQAGTATIHDAMSKTCPGTLGVARAGGGRLGMPAAARFSIDGGRGEYPQYCVYPTSMDR